MEQDGREVTFEAMDEAALALLDLELSESSRRALAHLLNNSLFLVTLSVGLLQEERCSPKELQHLLYAVQRLQTLIWRITHSVAPVDAASSLQART